MRFKLSKKKTPLKNEDTEKGKTKNVKRIVELKAEKKLFKESFKHN